MLDGIDDIEWNRLGHAYGGAGDVPGQIRALLSPDAQTGGEALRELYGNIYHQSTRYEATAYAVPFLLEILADPGTPDRVGIAEPLCGIAIGYDSLWVPGNLPIAEHRAEAGAGQAVLATVPAHLSDVDQGRLYAYFAVRAYDALRAGVPIFLDLLADPDPALRTMAAYTLAWFPEEASEILPRLASSTFDSEAAQATALVSVGLLGGQPDPALLPDSRPLVRWGAAIALRRQDELVPWVTDQAGTEAEIQFLNGDLGGLASLVLAKLDPDAAFDALLARIPSVAGTQALPPVSEALRLAFSGDSSSGVRRLTPKQRRLAQALADSPNTWLYNGMTFGNLSMLLTDYGLPRDCEKMREFLNT